MQYYVFNLYYIIFNKSILKLLKRCNKIENPNTASHTIKTKKKYIEVFLYVIIKKKVFIKLSTSIKTKQAKNRFTKKIKNTNNNLNISRKGGFRMIT